MRRGDWPAAFAVNDAVLAARDPATRDDPGQPYHLRWAWAGAPPEGRRVVVRCWHGLGDTLQFARYLPVLASRAAQVTLEAPPGLIPLLARLTAGCPNLALHPFAPDDPLPPGEVDAEIMELAHLLRLGPDQVSPPDLSPPGRPWPPVRAPGTVGLCWRAGDWNPARSIPLAALAPVLGDRRTISLQRGPAAAEAGAAFLNPSDHSTDILRTAALIGAAEIVVSVDSMVAHLAGVLHRPAIVLLQHKADWRWMAAGDRTPWHPGLTLLRQDDPGDWSGPLERLATLLKN